MENPSNEIHESVFNEYDSQEIANGSTPALPEKQPSKPVPPYPGFWQAIALLLIFLFFQVLFTIPFLIGGFASRPVALAIPILLSALITAAYGYKRSRALFCEIFPFKPTGIFMLSALLLTILGLHILLQEIIIFLAQALPPSERFSKFMQDSLGGKQSLLGSFVVLVFVAPITEEVLYRGIILNGFMRRYNYRKSILVSAFLFALMHGNPWQFIPAFCLGIFLAWCFVKTHSLIPCMFAHSINNLLAFIYSLLQEKFHIEPLPIIQSNLFYRLGWDALGLILAISGFFMLKVLLGRVDAQMNLNLHQI
jgi:membrane protease YdiL (CAAX protease family)